MPRAAQSRELKHRAEYRRRDRTASERGYNSDWNREAAWFRERFPFCCACTEQLVKVEQVDHIIPTQGLQDTIHFAPWNWQPLCRAHHTEKTKNHDSRLRRERRRLLALVANMADDNERRNLLMQHAGIWARWRDIEVPTEVHILHREFSGICVQKTGGGG